MKLLPKNGFTLVELMVVVAIIGILAATGLEIFSTAQQSARNARRKTDLQAIANTLEIHYLPNGGTCKHDDGTSKTITGAGYCSLQASWFSSEIIPTDPEGRVTAQGIGQPSGYEPAYCFKTVDTTMHGEGDGHCDTEYLPPDNYKWCSLSALPLPTGIPVQGSNALPADGVNKWTLCANLEPFTEEETLQGVSQHTFCVHSKQFEDSSIPKCDGSS